MCVPSLISDTYAQWQQNNIWLLIVCLVIYIALAIVIVCCKQVSRSVPGNYILLTVFVITLSYIVSVIASEYSPKIVIMAAAMTAAVTLALTIYAVTTKTDFTVCGGVLFVLGMSLLMFAIFTWLIGNYWLHVIYCALGVIVYGLYLIFDTQLIMGNKTHKIELDDYILGVFLLYIDIIMLFLFILRLMGGRR